MKSRISIYVLAIISVFALTNCGHNTEEAKKTVKYVKIAKVKSNGEKEKMLFNGVIKEKSLTEISFRVGGPINVLTVKTGDYVKAGDLIAAIDKRDYDLLVQSTKAQYEQLESEYQRYQKLFELNKIPANSFEKAESAYLMAKAAYGNAVNQLKDTDLLAPVSGYIHEKMVENFQTVGAGQTIVTIVDKSHLEVLISVPEKNISRVKKSKNNFLNVVNANIEDHPVSIYSIGKKAQSDGMFEVKLLLTDISNTAVFPGMSAEVYMQCSLNGHSLQIPSSALFRAKSETYVWVLDTKTKKIKKRRVEVARLLAEGEAEIVSGLKKDETIIVAGVNSLVDGQKVQPIVAVSKTNVGGLL